jgi:hypothetical protein
LIAAVKGEPVVSKSTITDHGRSGVQTSVAAAKYGKFVGV